MRRRRHRPISSFAGAGAGVLLMSLTVSCSTGSDSAGSDDATLSSFVERVVRDDDAPPFAQYFSLERFRAGTDVPGDLSEEELLTKVFLDESAEGMVVDPYLSMLKLSRADPMVIPFALLDASYSSFDGSGSVLVGDFDPDAIRTAVEDLGGDVTETETPAGISYRVAEDSIDTGDFPMDRLYSDTSILVAEDGSQVVFDAEGDGSRAFAKDGDATAADEAGVPEVAAALDDENVYAAALFFDGDDTASTDDAVLAEPWARAGLGTSIEDGQSRAVVALWHADDEDAEANAERAGELLGELAKCTGDADVSQEGPLVVASCGIEEAGFAQRTLSRVPMTPLYD